MPASIFLSHVYEDIWARSKIREWAEQGLLGPNVVVTGESEDVRQWGVRAIGRHLSPMLQGAAAVVVLVGNDTHNHHWVEYEVQHALSSRKRVVVVRIPGTTGAPPSVVAGRSIIPMDPSSIRTALGS